MKIFIAAHYNLNNGDRALLEATIRILKNFSDKNSIIVSAYKPELYDDKRFRTVGWPLRNGKYESVLLRLSKFKLFRNIFSKYYMLLCKKEYIDAIKESDIVLMSGGHHLTDILSTMGYYKLSSNFIVPIKMGKKVVMLPQSIGPARNHMVLESIKYILNNVYSIAYRDDSSRKFVDSLKIDCKMNYVPDLVYMLEPRTDKNNFSKIVGIALYHSYVGERRNNILPFTIDNLKKVIDELLKRKYIVKIIPMDISDEEIYYDIKRNLKNIELENNFIISNRSNNILDIIDDFNDTEFVLAYKTHSTIFSIICNSPLIAIAYHPKSIEFMDSISLAEYSINDYDASFENLMCLVDKIVKNANEIKMKEKIGVENNRKIISDYLMNVLD